MKEARTGRPDSSSDSCATTWMEYLEADFYNVKAKQVGLSGQAKEYATQFGAEESEPTSRR